MFLAIRPYAEMIVSLVVLMQDTKLNCFRDKSEEVVLGNLRCAHGSRPALILAACVCDKRVL